MRLPYAGLPKLSAGVAAAASCVALMSSAGCQPASHVSAQSAATARASAPPAATTPTSVRQRIPHRHGRLRILLPDHRRTPGAVNAAVTQASIRATICRTGYTSSIRPPSSYTTSLKVQQLDSGYAFRGDRSTRDYEEDHLIALELGGAPSNPRNLWPEPYATTSGARIKDLVENELHDLVCTGRLPLRVAQRAIATNWWRAYQRYGGRGVPDVYFGAYAGAATASVTSGTSAAQGATARCADGTLSYSLHGSGTCSHHGGVAQWINPPSS